MSGLGAASWAARVRFVRLYLRARHTPLVVTGVVATALLAWVLADWLVGSPQPDQALRRWPVAALAPPLVAVIMSAGLAGADQRWERAAAVRWWRIRAIHVVLAAVLLAAALALTGLWQPRLYGAFELARNTVAWVGLVALSAVLLGARLAYVPTVAYVLVVVALGPHDPAIAWWTWPVQPWSSTPAAASAAVLLATGAAAYSRWGARADDQ